MGLVCCAITASAPVHFRFFWQQYVLSGFRSWLSAGQSGAVRGRLIELPSIQVEPEAALCSCSFRFISGPSGVLLPMSTTTDSRSESRRTTE